MFVYIMWLWRHAVGGGRAKWEPLLLVYFKNKSQFFFKMYGLKQNPLFSTRQGEEFEQR